jgi:type II secretory pathway pseudopilin PulG
MSAGRFFKKEKGFTYIGLMIAVAMTGAGLAAYGEFASHAALREKEAELLFRGNQYREAIASYYKKEKRYPQSLEQLLKDPRYPMPVHHLRKLYPDPMTGAADWALIKAPEGGIMGVHSRSEEAPIKTGNFAARDAALAEAPRDPESTGPRYADWKFFHRPSAPGAKPG